MSLERIIAQVRNAETIFAALAASRRLRRQIEREGRPRATTRLLLANCGEDADALTQFLLIRALARVEGPLADDALVALLEDGDEGLRRHAAWALGERAPVAAALPGLVRLTAGGGFGTMLAQMAIERWSADVPRNIYGRLTQALATSDDPAERSRLVETLTLVPGSTVQGLLRCLICDLREADAVRAAAVRGLDPRYGSADLELVVAPSSPSDVGLRLATVDALGDLAERRDASARDALNALAAADDMRISEAARQALAGKQSNEASNGLRVAQIVLQGRVDARLDGAGGGDCGGLATLLVSLGRALGKRPGIARVYTVARAFGGEGVPETYGRLEEPMSDGATLVRLPFGPERDLPVSSLWRHRLQIERGLERLHQRLGRLDAIHLRFADAGTLAASRLARRRGIPVFFTLAPDPHAVIRGAETAGTLCRRSFARVDRREHLLFRAELVEDMVRDARRLALFPRPELQRDLRELLDVDVTAEPQRFWTVPEGIDTRLPRRSELEVRTPGRRPAVLAELERHIDRLDDERRGLPLLVGLGRLHPVKGCHRLVEAWAGDPCLRGAFNLLLIGGDLNRPSTVEVRVLEQIEDLVQRFPGARSGLLLFGRRSNFDAARLLAAARWGLGSRVAAAGVFVCASDKEEFGLAILEAMAAGLAVVAPDSGGPPTYIDDGNTGFLACTTSVPRLRVAIHRAAAAAADATRTRRARQLVRERFTIDVMAEALAGMYQASAGRPELDSAA